MAIPLVNVPQPQVVTPTPDYSGVTRGLMLYVQGRQNAQQNELAAQKLAQDMSLAQQKFGLDREQLAQDYAYKNAMLKDAQATQDENRQYHQNVLDQASRFHIDQVKQQQNALDSLNTLRQHMGDMYDAHAQYFKNYQQMSNDWNQQVLKNDTQALDEYNKLGLNNPERMTSDPLGYGLDARRWIDEYQNSPSQSAVHTQIASLKNRLAPLNIQLANGFDTQPEYKNLGKDPSTGQTQYQFVRDKAVPIGGFNQKASVLDVLQKLDDPKQADAMMKLLEASGYLNVNTTFKPVLDAKGKPVEGQTTPVTSATLNPGPVKDYIQEYLDKGKKLDFSRGESKVPQLMTPGPAANKGTGAERSAPPALPSQQDEASAGVYDTGDAAANPASTAAQQLQFSPTAQDQIMQYARLALANGAPPDLVAARLAKNYGINFNEMTGPSTPGAPSDQFQLAVQAA